MMTIRYTDNAGKYHIVDASYLEVEGIHNVEVHNKKWAFTIQEGEE